MARMKHDFFKDPEGPTADRFLAWMEEETTSLLRRCLGDMEALKGAIFLYVNRAYEANMPDAQIGALFGKAFVAYLPTESVVGISKIARVVEIFAKRLQTQETMTIQVAQAIEETLKPRGVAVLIDAEHQCMSTRGVHHKDVTTVTTQFTGAFKDDAELRNRFLKLAGYG